MLVFFQKANPLKNNQEVTAPSQLLNSLSILFLTFKLGNISLNQWTQFCELAITKLKIK